MAPSLSSPRSEHGFTLVEVLAAAFVLLVGVMSALALIDRANSTTAVTGQREAATNLARELVEAARGVPFGDLAGGTLDGKLQALPGLGDSAVGGGYTIKRRGITYTVTDSVCVMDDARDGGGDHGSGLNFCSQSVAAGTADKNPEDYKRVSVTASWTRRGVTRQITQVGIVNNPGSSTGPAVKSIVPNGWSAPFEITSDVATLPIKITTSSKPTNVVWSIDGTDQVTSPASDVTGLVWTANWTIHPAAGPPLDDGPYLIEAHAFNQFNVSGPGRSETITLNRFLPRAPTGVAGGRSGLGTVEIEWAANTERDIVGYQVERTDGTVVCSRASLKLSTYCVDANPPDADDVQYVVRAYDTAPGTTTPRSGPLSAVLHVVKTNSPPKPPGTLTLTSSSGVTTLQWTRPSNPVDPDSQDDIAFYRIYRDGQTVNDRYDRWYSSSSAITWQDLKTNGQPHTYWVTAVDKHYGESTAIGPVTG